MIGIALALALQALPAVPPPALPVAASAVDSTQKALVQRLAAKLMPTGNYRTMMRAMTPQVASGVKDSLMKMPLSSVARMAGASPDEIAKLGPTTLKQIMGIIDPVFDQRMQITMRVMLEGMGNLMTKFEPEYRAGLAEALMWRFTNAQLVELDRFFGTATGAAFADQLTAISADPATMRRMQSSSDSIMAAWPEMMKKAEDATAGLPQIKSEKDLTAADRAKLEALVGAAKKTP